MSDSNTKPDDWPEELPWPGAEATELLYGGVRMRLAPDDGCFALYQIVGTMTRFYVPTTFATAFIERAFLKRAETLKRAHIPEGPDGRGQQLVVSAKIGEAYQNARKCRAWDQAQREE